MPHYHKTFVKDPDSTLDYTRDWSRWLTTGDTISLSTWSVTGGISITAQSYDTTTATVWIDGGTVGTDCYATNTVTTAEGRIDERTFRILIREK